MVEVSDYCLPDIKLLGADNERFLVWIPDRKYIVLGASNHPEESLFTDNVIRDNIAVLKRPSGGQTVMLTPDNLIVSVVFSGDEVMHPKEIFNNMNLLLISALKEAGISDLSMMGISDIAISGKKISGSAIYRSKDKLLFHAVLNLGESPSTFEQYLRHPQKEPDYRNGRKHVDFVTSLRDKGYTGSNDKLALLVTILLNQNLS